ncbi:AAA family ATPase [Wolbachia endosymbiont of Madathamugadia hiepei]|nr:ATP-binding protein [Wolbachia endosymbiont of Madathamugadia hiepei]NUX01762.1 AAA family ATPase [Wolbachia endosymbiont of Madathamugadia hiepei]
MVTSVKIVIFGPYGIGKTSLLKTLEESKTLCLDFEAELLAVQGWKGDSIKMRTWNEARDIACLIGRPNPALKSDQAYSQRHYEHVSGKHKDLLSEVSKYRYIFIDSITVASRLCLSWARMQPEAFSDRSGREDKRAAYGTLAQEMMAWLNQFQHIPNKDIIIVGTLGQRLDDLNRSTWLLQCEGAKTASEIPGIVDEVISMVGIKQKDGTEVSSFVCQTINSWGYPAKDRSGCLEMVEEPRLGKLLTKIKAKVLATAA